ncbi:thermosome subunit [Candidatus Woesearchaeota archaeon]|jgi:thermosome|nr:thermosome subunit [Candidatus Woesearchaeota archaeon]
MEKDSLNVMPDDIQRLIGREAQKSNILAARTISEIVKTTLGPKGMDKMLVSQTNEVTITNDGATILKEMQIEHPAAKIMVDIAKTQESEVGDGTTSVVMIAGKLLENAEKLLNQKVHPISIINGYKLAEKKCQEFLNELSININEDDDSLLKKIAITSMTGKGAESLKEQLSEIALNAIKQIKDENIDLSNIKIQKIKGSSIYETKLILGMILDKERISKDMPERIENAKIALFDIGLEIRNPEIETKISISSPEQLENFIEQEERFIREIVKKIVENKVNVIFCQKGVDEFAQYLLSKEKIYVCRRVSRSDMEKISRATGAKIITNLDELSESQLGYAESVEERKEDQEYYTYINGCKNPKSLTILIRGTNDYLLDEIERALEDALGVISSSIKTKKIVLGAGATDIELSKMLKDFNKTVQGKEKLAVEEFANSLEFIPLTLSENAGLDPIEILTELKTRHENNEGEAGINLLTNKIENIKDSMIFEPYRVKSQAISSATEAAIMILRIDDVIAAKEEKFNNRNQLDDYE